MGIFDFIFGKRKTDKTIEINRHSIGASTPYNNGESPKVRETSKTVTPKTATSNNQSAKRYGRWTKSVSHDSLYKKCISFHVERYEQWQGGACTAKGCLDFDLHIIAKQTGVSVDIPNLAQFRMHNHVDFPFIGSQVLHDRIQYVNAPGDSEDSTRPIILHIFVKNGKIDCIRFAMSFPDRIIEFYGYQIESQTSKMSDITEPTVRKASNEDYKLTFLSSLVNVATCDGGIADVEMQTIMAYLQRETLSEADLIRVLNNPQSVPHSIPTDPNLRAQHLRDIVTLSMVDGHFHPKEYELCKQIALGLGFRPEVIDIIRQELNAQIGANI